MIADQPCAGRKIELHLTVRRFVCNVVHCRRKIFAERFGDGVIRPMARRTARLDCLVRHLALALGGRPAARFADRLGLPVSNDTLLRTVRRYDRPPPPNACSMRDICDESDKLCHSWTHWQRRVHPRKSCVEQGTAESWFAALFAVNGPTSTESGKRHSNHTCLGSRCSGTRACETALNCGGSIG